MDKFIDARFERLEKALGSLIDSVTKYHPSATLAEELKVADAELANGLEQVQTHQKNRLRILELRQKSFSLDHQIRETLTSLAQTRQEVVATPTTKFPSGPSYPIVYEELLSYARRISKTTMPPAATIHASSAATLPASGMQTPTVGESQSQAVTPAAGGATPGGGTTTTAAATPVAVGPGTAAGTTTPLIPTQSPRIVNGTPRPSTAGLPSASAPPPQPPQQQQQQQPSITGLPEHMAQYLNPLSGQVFFPWPPEDKIRSGSLASNQILLEQGIDPCGYDPAAEEARRKQADAERREREEREARAQEERARQMHEERERLRRERERLREKEQDEWRRASIAAGAGAGGSSSSTADGPGSGGGGAAAASRGGPEKRQFQFTNLDDLDDDDDDEED